MSDVTNEEKSSDYRDFSVNSDQSPIPNPQSPIPIPILKLNYYIN